MICGTAEFEVRTVEKHTYRQVNKLYRVRFNPHDGMTIEAPHEDGWKVIKRRAEPEDLEAILPQGDFMHKWTYGDFILAMTFFGQGRTMGYAQGRWDTQREYQKKETQAITKEADLPRQEEEQHEMQKV